MKHYKRVAKKAPVNVGIYFRGDDRLVAQHFLHRPEICTGLYHVCCK